MYHLTVLRFEAWNSSRQYTSPVTNSSEHVHVTLKYTHRPIQQLETCYVQRLTKFDVRFINSSSSLEPMFILLPNFLQKTAVSFCADHCQLFIDISSRRMEQKNTQKPQTKMWAPVMAGAISGTSALNFVYMYFMIIYLYHYSCRRRRSVSVKTSVSSLLTLSGVVGKREERTERKLGNVRTASRVWRVLCVVPRR